MRRWLITGASGGLGRALAEAALAAGHRVAGTFRDPEALATFEARAPGQAFGTLIDLVDLRAIPTVVGQVLRRLGGLDIVVNNAGYALAGAVEEITPTEAEAILATNFLAPMTIAQAALPHMRGRPGARIINISSLAALESYPGLGLYCASKAALSALSEAQAIELEGSGIAVISVEATGLRTRFAGPSLRYAERRLAEYRDLRSRLEEGFARSHGRQRGDPEVAAARLLELALDPDPPGHFALGEDAPERVAAALRRKLDAYRLPRRESAG